MEEVDSGAAPRRTDASQGTAAAGDSLLIDKAVRIVFHSIAQS